MYRLKKGYNMYTVPILLIIYNRSQEILQQIASLKKIQAQEIYIYADGPKESEIDKVNCNNARSTLLNLIDWECKIITFFNDKNSGCGRGPYTAINWFFENVEEGIILEDDCIPNLSFFSFCRELLVKYKHDTRVWQISGTNRLGTYFDETDYSYIFSRSAKDKCIYFFVVFVLLLSIAMLLCFVVVVNTQYRFLSLLWRGLCSSLFALRH